MEESSTNFSKLEDDAAAALLEAGHGSVTAPLYQRRMCRGDHLAVHRELNRPTESLSLNGASRTGLAETKVSQTWVTVAACLVLFFLALCGVWRIYNEDFSLNPPPPRNMMQAEETDHSIADRDVRELPRERFAIPDSEAFQPREIGMHSVEDGAFDDEDEHKQHPDSPFFVDAWNGEEVQRLNLSRGIEGLKTPLYRLPFTEGQHNHTHAIGLHGQALAVPRYLLVTGGQGMNQTIDGRYNLLMTSDGRPKPLLVHGRPIWRRSRSALRQSTDFCLYLFYDHTHHTWVFSGVLRFHNLRPLAFLPHGALLPVMKNRVRTTGARIRPDGLFRAEAGRSNLTQHVRYGVPAGIPWIRREADNDVGLTADSSIRVTGDPTRNAPQDFYNLSIQKVFHAREDGGIYADDEEDDGVEEAEIVHVVGEEIDDDNAKLLRESFTALDENFSMRENKRSIFHLPASTKTRQQFLTHPLTLVYHTFEETHFSYPHAKIVEDPVGFLEKNPHPDIETLERQFGDDSTAVPHPLRVSYFT